MSQELGAQCITSLSLIDGATVIATVAAIVAAASAWQSYRLSKKIYDEIKSDEVIVAGPLHHPGLREPDHDNSVLRCALFNKSKRKTYIKSVEAFEKNGDSIEIDWSGLIDDVGNIIDPTRLLGIEDSVNLHIRRRDGDPFEETKVTIKHSLRSDELVILYDPYEGWGEDSHEQG